MNAPRMDRMLLDLYACPAERERWPVVLNELCHALHARSAVVQLLVRDGLRARARWMVRDSASEAEREVHDRYLGDEVNPRMRMSPIAIGRQGPTIMRDRDLFAPDDPAWGELRERLAAARLGAFMSAGTLLPGGERLALVLHRDIRCRREFDAGEERLALRFLPHLRQAVQLAAQLADASSEASELAGALDSVRAALILCNADGKVCQANRAARELFGRRHHLWLDDQQRLAAAPADLAQLRRLLQEAAAAAPAAAPRFQTLGGAAARPPLQVRLQALQAPDLPPGAVAPAGAHVLLVLSDLAAPAVLPAELLVRLFGLSPAEARLAAALCRGLSLAEHAAAQRVAVGTARYQLKQVMAKLQVSRQSQLVQRLFTSVIAQTLA